jgi:hypothetical protein
MNWRISETRSPMPAGSADDRSSHGRNVFSRRNVYGWTTRPARCASLTKLVGLPEQSSAVRGMM